MLRSRFVQGRAKYADYAPDPSEPTAKIYVNVRFAGLDDNHVAQLDTGAAWSVLSPRVVKDLGIGGWGAGRVRLSTRFGVYEGHLVRVPLTLIADQGESLETEGVFFVCRDWPVDQTFLGYTGLLDKIRFALDPQENDFYFGV
jgi:hypothetical protein